MARTEMQSSRRGKEVRTRVCRDIFFANVLSHLALDVKLDRLRLDSRAKVCYTLDAGRIPGLSDTARKRLASDEERGTIMGRSTWDGACERCGKPVKCKGELPVLCQDCAKLPYVAPDERKFTTLKDYEV